MVAFLVMVNPKMCWILQCEYMKDLNTAESLLYCTLAIEIGGLDSQTLQVKSYCSLTTDEE